MRHTLVLIDHYDSFTRNVLGWLDPGDGRVSVSLIPFDDAEAMRRVAAHPVPLVLSPGPKRPENAPQSLALLKKLHGTVPILGICLGHQLLAAHAGAAVVRARAPFHGTTRVITLQPPASRLFVGIRSGFRAAVYNSLTVDPRTIPDGWAVVATSDNGEVQGLAHEPPAAAPAYGVQFHPESFLSEMAPQIRANWLAILDAWAVAQTSALAPLSDPS